MNPSRIAALGMAALAVTGCAGRAPAGTVGVAPAAASATPSSAASGRSPGASPTDAAGAAVTAASTGGATTPGAAQASSTQLPNARLLALPVSARPSRPVLPRADRINTTAAAKVVAGYFFAALDHAARTGDHGPLDQVAHPRCAWCSEQVTHLYDNDPQGGALDPLHRARPTDAFRYDASNVIVHVWHEYGHNARLRVHGRITVATPLTERSTVCLWWVGDRWRVGCASSSWLTPAEVRNDAERQLQEDES